MCIAVPAQSPPMADPIVSGDFSPCVHRSESKRNPGGHDPEESLLPRPHRHLPQLRGGTYVAPPPLRSSRLQRLQDHQGKIVLWGSVGCELQYLLLHKKCDCPCAQVTAGCHEIA